MSMSLKIITTAQVLDFFSLQFDPNFIQMSLEPGILTQVSKLVGAEVHARVQASQYKMKQSRGVGEGWQFHQYTPRTRFLGFVGSTYTADLKIGVELNVEKYITPFQPRAQTNHAYSPLYQFMDKARPAYFGQVLIWIASLHTRSVNNYLSAEYLNQSCS